MLQESIGAPVLWLGFVAFVLATSLTPRFAAEPRKPEVVHG